MKEVNRDPFMVFKQINTKKIIHSLYFGAPMSHQQYMMRCLTLAQNGMGQVSPNPMVGSVIVKNGRIIGEGYHQKHGGPHAEVNAIASVKNKTDLLDSTIYVSLEPCAHHGKTPPCADLIISSKIPRVVIGAGDPNPKVAGQGIARMRAAGVEVIEGVLVKEARHLNRRFLTFHEKKRPYVILKWAQSADGFMDAPRDKDSSGVNWISHPNTKKMVHQWRAEENAILVGGNTIRNDNPTLTVREVDGKNPIRVIISASGELPKSANIFKDNVPTLIFNQHFAKTEGNVEWVKVSEQNFLTDVLKDLHQKEIQSVFVEGGANTLESFISAGLWDEIRMIQAPHNLNQGLKAPRLPLGNISHSQYGADTITTLFAE